MFLTMMRNTIPTTKISNPLSAYCPYSVARAFRPVSAVVVVVVVVCAVCWSFWLDAVPNHGHCVVLAGVYLFPNKKFLICVVPHIICMHAALSFHRALLVNCEIFSRVAGFLS